MFKKICHTTVRHFWKRKLLDFGNYDIVQPGIVTSRKFIPDEIKKPSYYKNGIPSGSPAVPEIKTDSQIAKMRDSCKLASKILHEVGSQIRINQTTDEIDTILHELCLKYDAYPSPLNYKGFPKSVCTSVNNVACHGVPDDRPLQDGDIINIDVTVYFNGYHGDCSKTFLVGNVDDLGKSLVLSTEQCLEEAIQICRPGAKFCNIGNVIESRAKQLGFNVIPSLCGHGIGEYFHGLPEIYHCHNEFGGTMKTGMTFTIEPALTQGSEGIVILEDGWTAVTEDNARSAQCEHTVLITKDSVEILTLPS